RRQARVGAAPRHREAAVPDSAVTPLPLEDETGRRSSRSGCSIACRADERVAKAALEQLRGERGRRDGVQLLLRGVAEAHEATLRNSGRSWSTMSVNRGSVSQSPVPSRAKAARTFPIRAQSGARHPWSSPNAKPAANASPAPISSRT